MSFSVFVIFEKLMNDNVKVKKLSYNGVYKSFGADERNRTVDLLITNELLYQLSYIGLVENYIRACGGLCVLHAKPLFS